MSTRCVFSPDAVAPLGLKLGFLRTSVHVDCQKQKLGHLLHQLTSTFNVNAHLKHFEPDISLPFIYAIVRNKNALISARQL